MACVHLQQLYDLCQRHDIKLSGSDLIHLVCEQCGKQEVCPSMLIDHHDPATPPSTATTAVRDDSMRP